MLKTIKLNFLIILLTLLFVMLFQGCATGYLSMKKACGHYSAQNAALAQAAIAKNMYPGAKVYVAEGNSIWKGSGHAQAYILYLNTKYWIPSKLNDYLDAKVDACELKTIWEEYGFYEYLERISTLKYVADRIERKEDSDGL